MLLPIESFKEECIRTVRKNTFTIIEGFTGCGKSTNIPLYLSELGGKVIVTQPRRLAAISLANRVSKKLGPDSLGNVVGYHTGLNSNFSDECKIVFMTEGTELIRQLASKEDLTNTILIIDEIHEWSVNVDILLAFAKKLIKDGKNLKLVLMSATLNSNKLSTFLDDAPVIKVSCKSYSVSWINRPANDLEKVVLTLATNKNNVLVFLPGKLEIEELYLKLCKLFKAYKIYAKILQLHGDLSYEDQQLVFKNYFEPKVILATNIAQTSITISDLDAIVDTGLDKSLKVINGIETLVTQQISKSDCIQRKGRVGRCSPGSYYLCSDFSYEKREEYPSPEIMNSNFEGLLLTLINYNIYISSMEFFHTPSIKQINYSIDLLKKLGAISDTEQITQVGKEMCKLPLGVRSSRILVESKKYGIEYDMLICCLLIELGEVQKITEESKSKYGSIKSDLLYQLQAFKDIYFSDKKLSYCLDSSIRINTYSKIVEYMRKILPILDIEPSRLKPNIDYLKKCLSCGFPDYLFILENRVGYKHNITAAPRKPYRNSIIAYGGHKYILGIPRDFSNETVADKSHDYKRIVFPTSLSLDEVLMFFCDFIEEKHTISNGIVYKHLYYNEVEVTSYSVGTIEELKVSTPEAFHEEQEYYKKFNQYCVSTFYYDLKISSHVLQ